MQSLQANAREQQKNQEAESDFVRRKLWGQGGQSGGNENETDDMGHTILGDINHPAPIIMPQPQSSLPTIAALAATLAAGGLAGYLLSRPDQPAPQPIQQIEAPSFDDSSVSIGLGRIEDYIKAEGQGQ